MKAIALMLLGSASFTMNDAAMKLALASLPYGQAVALRGVTSCLLLFAFAFLKIGMKAAIWHNVRGQFEASAWYVVASFAYVYALPYLDFPVAVTAVYTAPLFAVILAWWFLDETLRPVTVLSTILGFAGVILAVGIHGSALDWMVLLPVASALATAIRDIKLRGLTKSENSFSILLAHQTGLTLFGIVYAIFEAPPALPPPTLSYVSAVSASTGAILGIYFTVEAFRYSEIGSISAFRYSAILWAALLGVVVWGNHVDSAQIAGMLLVAICGATVAVERHLSERRRRNQGH